MRVGEVLVLAALCAASPAIAKPKPKPKPPAPAPLAAPHLAVVRLPDGWRADLRFDGPLLGWALPRSHDGHRAVLLLIGRLPEAKDKDGPAPCTVGDVASKDQRNARLFRWSSDSPEALEPLASDLPAGELEAADLDGDGTDELLLIRDGRIDLVTIGPDGTAETHALAEDAALGKPLGGPRVAWDERATLDPNLRVSLLGEFRTYRRKADGSTAIASELGLPLRATPGAERVRVASPAVFPIGKTKPGRMVFATDPEPLGKRRLRTLLLDPDGPPESQTVESWALFPSPERVVDSAFAILNGAPMLVVTTTSAEKLSLLGEKALRVYPLGGDRTRAGDQPVFAATTGINLWQVASPAIVDLDRDGRDDLVLAYWKGLKNAIAALEVYRGGAGSGFAKPETTSFDVEGGEKGFMAFGADVDGDGLPDLVLLAKRELLVFPGSAPGRAIAKTVASTPSRRIALPELPNPHRMMVTAGLEGFQIERIPGGLGTPHLLDVDGDGRPEVLFAGNGGDGAALLTVVFVRQSAALAPSSTISK